MTTHELKTFPSQFEPIWAGDKPFEIRLDDRAFQRGDDVVLREWDRDRTCFCGAPHEQDCEKYTGRKILAGIGHVTGTTPPRGSQRGFNGNGYVVFSLIGLSYVTAPTETPVKPTPRLLAASPPAKRGPAPRPRQARS